MKLSKLMLLPLCAFLFASCSPAASSSEVVPSISETETSKDSISEENYGWDQETVKLMKENLHGEVLPYSPLDGGVWSLDLDLEGLTYIKQGGATENEFKKLCSVYDAREDYVHYIDQGSTEEGLLNSIYIKPLQHYDDLDESIVVVAAYSIPDDLIHVSAYYDINVKEFDADKFNYQMKRVFGITGISIPAPSFETNYIQIQGVANPGEDDIRGVYVTFGLLNESDADTYETQLLNSGYTAMEGNEILTDSSKTIGVDLYLESYGDGNFTLNLDIYLLSDLFIK